MSKFSEQNSGRNCLSIAAAFLAGVALVASARGTEPKCEIRVQSNLNEVKLPFLGELPYVGQLFRYSAGACPAEGCTDHLQRVGVDFDIAQPRPGQGMIIVKRLECQQCAAQEAAEAKCAADHCCECESLKATLAKKHATGHPADDKPSWEQIVELASEKAALEATLEVHEAIAEAKEELYESFTELVAEKAALEAKLEAQGEREELAKRVHELATENAHLKARVELANLRTEMMQKTMQVAVENEHLKHRVGELERQSAGENAATARAAKRNQTGKKVR